MKRFFRKLLCMTIAALTVATLCTAGVSADSAKLSKSSVKLPVGYSITLKVSGTDKDVTWSSSDKSVASVKSSDGASAKIVGGKTGTAYIYAKAKGVDLKCKVVVRKSFISANEDDIELEKGKTEKVILTVKGSKKIAFSISDKSVCSVSWGKWDGNKIALNVKAKSNGTADIKVYAKGFSKSTAETIEVKVGRQNDDDIIIEDYDDDDDDDDDDRDDDDDNADEYIKDVVEIVNDEREDEGLPDLMSDPTLNRIAAQRAKETAEKFSHTRPDGTLCFTAFDEFGVDSNTVYAAENIAYGSRTADGVMDQWMGSSGHKANILREDFTRIGVGLYVDNGKYYWVQVFSSDF